MSDKIPPRITWAVERLDIRPDQNILEIGCGDGVAAFLISEELKTGKIIAIDSSSKMIGASLERNRDHINSGRCKILELDWLSAPSLGKKFDTIFVYNMNVLWMDPKAEIEAVASMLNPNGRFFIFHRPPPGSDSREYALEFEKNLIANKFRIESVEFNDDESIRSLCVIAKLIRR